MCDHICCRSLSLDRRSRLRGGILCPELYRLHLHGWRPFRDGASLLCCQGVRCCGTSSEGPGTRLLLSGSREPARIPFTFPQLSPKFTVSCQWIILQVQGTLYVRKETSWQLSSIAVSCRIPGQDCSRQVLWAVRRRCSQGACQRRSCTQVTLLFEGGRRSVHGGNGASRRSGLV